MLRIRPGTDEDSKLLWEWANDPDTRASAFQPDPIPWEEHVAWFCRKRADPNCYICLLVEEDDNPVGQVRFEVRDDGCAEVDISIARNRRGHGYGVQALRLACEHLLRVASPRGIVAYIKPQNVASIRAFEKAGFVHDGTDWVKGHEAVRMRLPTKEP